MTVDCEPQDDAQSRSEFAVGAAVFAGHELDGRGAATLASIEGAMMSANPKPYGGAMDPFPEEDERPEHSPEPWTQDGRYIRDANGVIVVRGKSFTDARRIVAAVNGTRGIPTEAMEGWTVQDVSDPETRPDFEIVLEEEPRPSPVVVAVPSPETAPVAPTPGPPQPLIFDRRVMERRQGERRKG